MRVVHLLLAAILAILALMFTPKANAFDLKPTVVGLHIASYHIQNTPPGQPGFNNDNHGLYLKWTNGLTIGTLMNSVNRRGNYIAQTFEKVVSEHVSIAITAGVIRGYDKLVQDNFTGVPSSDQHVDVRCNADRYCRPVLLKSVLAPLVVPSVAYNINEHVRARLSWIVKTHKDSAHAAHLSVEWVF